MAMTEENGTTPEQEQQTHRALNVQDDERMPEQQEQQPAQGHVTINMTPQSMNIQITPQPITLVIDEANMDQMVKEWLANHPELFDELVKQRVTQKKTELAIISDIKSSRVN